MVQLNNNIRSTWDALSIIIVVINNFYIINIIIIVVVVVILIVVIVIILLTLNLYLQIHSKVWTRKQNREAEADSRRAAVEKVAPTTGPSPSLPQNHRPPKRRYRVGGENRPITIRALPVRPPSKVLPMISSL